MATSPVTVEEAQTMLAELILLAAEGKTVILTDNQGNAVARLVPPDAHERAQKRFGILKGTLELPDDLDAPLSDEVIRDFEGDGKTVQVGVLIPGRRGPSMF